MKMRPFLAVLTSILFFQQVLSAGDPAPVQTVKIPMRDGILLATDIYLPAPEAKGLPCLLMRTPYGRKRYNRELDSMAQWGYAVAIQDTRGRFDSEGKPMGFQSDGWGEQQDGHDTVEWLARQPFTNGRVATAGASAMGITQLLLAGAAPPSLVCQYIAVAPASLYHHATYVGGALREEQVVKWMRENAHPDALKLIYEHPHYDAHWELFDTARVAERIRAPAIHYGGWFDTFCDGTIAAFQLPLTRFGDDLDTRRYDEVQFKAAHNSIDREETLSQQLDSDPEAPHQGGCRGLELDIVMDPSRAGPKEEWRFGVQHGGAFKENGPKLDQCLREIRDWSKVHPGHHAITIHIDIKEEATLGDDAVFIDQIDALFARELDRDQIYRPAHLQRDAPTLLAGAQKYGWPALGELRGKFILVFSGGDSEGPVRRRRAAYARTRPRDRLAFVDLDQRAAGEGGADECDIQSPYYQEGSRAFVNLQLGRKDWQRLARGAHGRGFVVREWKANDEKSWSEAAAAGVNILSTDRVRGHPWATVGPKLFAAIKN